MRYPKLKTRPALRKTVDMFGGLNQNPRIGDGEFFHMENLTSDDYPLLSPRPVRGIYAKPASPQALIAKDQLCYVDGADFVMGQQRIPMGLSVREEDCPKRLVSMGAYVIIWPDKKYINTCVPEDRGDIEAVFEASGQVKYRLCTADGGSFGEIAVSPTAPEQPENLQYWLDTAAVPHTLKQYAASSESWVALSATYIKIEAAGIGKPFSRYDGVHISGAAAEVSGDAVIWEKGDDFIVISGLLDETITQTGGLILKREMPLMDFLIESGNRLWGCRYGENKAGQVVNEIYASKLGDFKNWNCFMGISTDSYAASVGSAGPFTGAVNYLGCPHFFKENTLHKVYGRYPANFQVQETACRGVQPGCHESLAIANETLFYKSRSGICAFDGSLPVDISEKLGQASYSDAVGGALHRKYYVSMKDEAGHWHLLVYDTARNLWHREDHLQAAAFCAWGGELYCIDGESRNILALRGSGEPSPEPVHWSAETGDLGLQSPDRKYLSRLSLRMRLGEGAKAELFARYDPDGHWEHLCTLFGSPLRSFTVPVRPRRSDHFRLKLQGTGEMKLYSMTKTIEEGSENP